MYYFQLTNILLPLTLPWTFMMLQSGVRNGQGKMNQLGYIMIYFVALVFPIYYFFDLLRDREGELIKERDDKLKELKEDKKKEKNIKKEKSSSMNKKVRWKDQ